MSKNPRLIKFTVTGMFEFMILKMIKNTSHSAHEVQNKLKEIDIKAPLGTIYPIFKRIRAKGLVSSGLEEFDDGSIQKTYCLNEKGRQHIAELLREWKHLNRFITGL